MDEVGFVRNAAARQLTGARTPAIGLVVLDIDNPFYAEVYRGVEAAANEVDHLVVLCGLGGDLSRETNQLRLLEEQRVAGILATRVTRGSARIYNEIRKRGTPFVLVDRRGSRPDQCSASVDDVEGGRLAADHLLERGHRRIGLINGPRALKQCVERRTGFLRALGEADLEFEREYDVEADLMTITAGEEAAQRLLALKRRPTAIFCANDLLALGAEHVLLATGCQVPGDVAVLGYDDVAFATMAFVPLTSIRQPAFELGYRAAQLLLDEASGGPHRHERIVFNPELVVRQSTTGDGLGERLAPSPAAIAAGSSSRESN
jgi:LacI family transcriptional regulator